MVDDQRDFPVRDGEAAPRRETKIRVAIVAGEPSGDVLGARLIRALRAAMPDVDLAFEGVGGDAMLAEGFDTIFALERLSVMGLVEPLGRLPELFRRRRGLVQHWRTNPPALFIGIDAPDFNLGLARKLKHHRIATAHLVSPTVWAWRPGRIRVVERSCDHLLCLFPFEPELYKGTAVRATFVGHPMAAVRREIGDRAAARERLEQHGNQTVFAFLPGSREAEIRQLLPDFVRAAQLLRSRDPARRVLLPAANAERYAQLREMLAKLDPAGDIVLLNGHSRETMLAANVVILASGTASLEAMLLERPMVVAYRMAALSWTILSRLAVTKFVGLPNILVGRAVVPELLQDELSSTQLALEAERLLLEGKAQLEALAQARSSLEVDFDEAIGKTLRPLLKSENREPKVAPLASQ
ncbi:MAG: lipid-A-disaccharide synthase [Pseudomonadota bacterium]